jgi:hypothetical protein
MYYGFTIPSNKYDSYAFRICMDYYNEGLDLERVPEEALYFESPGQGEGFVFRGRKCLTKELSREIRLKQQSFCQQLVVFLRVFLLPYYSKLSP